MRCCLGYRLTTKDVFSVAQKHTDRVSRYCENLFTTAGGANHPGWIRCLPPSVHQYYSGARTRFEEQAWRDVQKAAQERIDLYEDAVEAVHRTLSERVGYENLTPEIWAETRRNYVVLIQERTDPELCETFFNSIYCDIFKHQNINDDTAFLNYGLVIRCECDRSGRYFHAIPI